MRLSITLLLIIGALFLNVQAQQQKLLAVEHDVAQVPREYFLTAYIFQDGNLIKKDTINRFQELRGQINYLQFDPNKTIIKNNYLKSSSVIIDTDSKEILWKKSKWDNFELYMLRGDSVIFRAFKTINREEKSIFNCYDLKHKTFRNFPENTKLNSNQFESRISRYKVSPDGKKAIYTLNSDSGSSRENRILHDLYYKPQNTFKSYNKNINERTIAKKISIARMGNIELSKVGTAWLDNHTILYADYEYPGENIWYSKGNVHVYKFNIATNTKEKICQIDSTSLSNWFEIDAKNEIFYRAADNNFYYLDLKNKKYDTTRDFFLSNTISYSYSLNSSQKTYKYKGEIIGALKTRSHIVTENA